MKRGTTYNTTFAITTTEAGNPPLDLTGATAKFVVETQKFAAVIDAPAANGTVSVELTPTETSTIDRGRRQAWCEITFPDGDIRAYGEHAISVRD